MRVGGRNNFYHPVNFSPIATKLVRLGVGASKIERAAVCSEETVEAIVLDSKKGTLLTLVNWSNRPVKNLQVRVRLPRQPKRVRSVRWQRALTSSYANGVLTFRVDLEDADYILLPKS